MLFRSLREDGGVVSGRMGNLALEASGVASPENDRSEAASQDSSGLPKKLSPAEELRARLARAGKKEATAIPEDPEEARAYLLAALRGGGKESPDASSQPPEKAVKTGESNDQPEANTQGDEDRFRIRNLLNDQGCPQIFVSNFCFFACTF